MCNKVWARFRNFLRANGNGREATLFSMFNKIRLCGIEENFQANGITRFGGLNLFC